MILVTGGFGFIGSHLVERLLERGECVHVVDNLKSCAVDMDFVNALAQKYSGALSYHYDNVAYFVKVPLWTGCNKDYILPNVTHIYHLASVVGPAGVLQHAGQIAHSIIRDTKLLMDYAQRHGARLIDVSTSEVYGGINEGYCREDSPHIISNRPAPRVEYAAGKLAAEVAIRNACAAGKLDAVIVRPFNVAGPRQSGRGGFVLPRFVGQALADLPLTVFGDGEQQRAFTHVSDIVDGLLLLAEAGTSGNVYNVGNPANRGTINQLADLVLTETGSTAGTVHVNPQLLYGDSYVEAPDKWPSAARIMDLGWWPRYTRGDTVRDVITWMQSLNAEWRQVVSGIQRKEVVS